MRAHHNLGKAYFEKGQIDQAIREGEIAFRLSATADRKENVKFVLNLLGGVILSKATSTGTPLFNRAIEIDPNFATSYYNASCSMRQQEKEKALEYLTKAISLDQNTGQGQGGQGSGTLRGIRNLKRSLASRAYLKQEDDDRTNAAHRGPSNSSDL